MLATPEKFNWVKSFLTSPLWEIIKEPIAEENSISFIIPNESISQMAPPCLGIEAKQSSYSPSTPSRKRKGKEPLVESEVRISPRIVELNGGFKSHINCSISDCLTCNAAPPCLNLKVVKNLAASLCKVKDGDLDKRLLKKGKATEVAVKAPIKGTNKGNGSSTLNLGGKKKSG